MQVVKDWHRRHIGKILGEKSQLALAREFLFSWGRRQSILISPNPMFIHADASWADHERLELMLFRNASYRGESYPIYLRIDHAQIGLARNGVFYQELWGFSQCMTNKDWSLVLA